VPDRYAPPDPKPTLPAERIRDLREQLAETLARTPAPRVVGLFDKVATGVLVRRDEAEVVAGVGFGGDHALKDYWRGKRVPGREVSVSSREVLDTLGVDWHLPGDNVVLEGLDLRLVPVGATIAIGSEVVLERSAAVHRPCGLFADRAGAEAYAFTYAEDLRGVLCYARRGGIIRLGDAVEVTAPPRTDTPTTAPP
jgi:MOSC domain-containing protein YiiM